MIKYLIDKIHTIFFDKTIKYKNKHIGETCYIFGGGSSIKWMDLAWFGDKPTIAMNYLPFHKKFPTLNADYCVLSSPYFFSRRLGKYDKVFRESLYEISKDYRNVVKNNPKTSFFLNLTNILFFRRSNLFYNLGTYPLDDHGISEKINCFNGALRHSISLAIYMGFSKVYLVGCDYTFCPSSHKHWFEKGKGFQENIDNYEFDFFSLASKHIEIETVLIDGKSQFLPSITYFELTGCQPKYQENIELLDQKYLNLLALWKGYEIY